MSSLDLPLWEQFLFTCEDHLLSDLILSLWLGALFYTPSVRSLSRKLPLLLLFAPVTAAVNWGAARIIQNVPLMLLLYLLNALFFTFWSMWVWRRPFWHCLAAVCMAGMMESSLSVIFTRLIYACVPTLSPEQVSPFMTMCLLWLTLPLFHFALSTLLGRLWPKERFCVYLEHVGDPWRTALLLAALDAAFVVLNHMQYGVETAYLAEYLLVAAVMTILVTALVLHLALRNMDLRKLDLQADMLARQQLYARTLEELQEELRTFRHDCRNLLVGLTDGPGDGRLSRSFQELETGFERRLGEKIRAASQIGNLRIPQIQGLLLHKMAWMAEQHIPCHLEVLYPVEHAAMDTWDLVRCLGILTDNAAEAARKTARPWVEILLLQEGPVLTLRVSNPWTGGEDPACFWKEGWSTKGNGRGTGLFSYQKILKRYPGASSATRWSDEIFIQELSIEEPGGRL